MKYLTDVFMLQNKNKMTQAPTPTHTPTPSNSSLGRSFDMEAPISREQHLAPINQTSQNIPMRESIKKTDFDRMKSKVTSSIMYTQLPGKKMKENKEKIMMPSASQFFSTPSNPNIRMQPYSFTKGNMPNGFISYNEFLRPSVMTGDQTRPRNQVSNSSSKATSITQ